jgi:protein SCO1
MKTKFSTIFLIAATALGRSLLAGDSSEPSRASALLQKGEPACCAVESKQPPCCVEEKSAAQILAALPNAAVASPSHPLTARSLYQLDAAWTNDTGATVQLATLRGQPVVLAMFFASCEYACPVLVHDMQRLRAALPEDVRAKTRFVLVSFDTERDTPAALKAYRERMSLDSGWTLLRGDTASVQELAMLLGIKFKQDARGQFSHSNIITVLNPEGEITHQRPGLMGDVSEAARAVERVAQPNQRAAAKSVAAVSPLSSL